VAVPRRPDVSMTETEVLAFLEEPRTGVLSTLARDGGPHSAGMWFVVRDGALEMWTYSKSQKAINARRDPRAAFLVEEGTSYSELRGVLVRGALRMTSDYDEVVGIGRRLYDRYTLPTTKVAVDEGPIVEIERQAAKRVGLILPLRIVASWDHRKL
jgi:PPOX class probable F420-dependent enzyme